MPRSCDRGPACCRSRPIGKRLRKTIHVIDDDVAVLHAVSLMLEAADFDVAAYPSAEHFLAADPVRQQDCVLVDVRMPGMGGLELQRRLQARGNPPPVILMTGHPTVAAARTALTGGAVDFLPKPLSEIELMDAVTRALTHESDECGGAVFQGGDHATQT